MKSRQQKKAAFKSIIAESYASDSPYMDDEEDIIEIEIGVDDETAIDDTLITPNPEIMAGLTPHPDNDNVITGDLIRVQTSAKMLQDICSTIEPDNWMVAKIAKATDYIDEVLKRMEAKSSNTYGGE